VKFPCILPVYQGILGRRRVRNRLHPPPTSPRFEAFSGEVRKLRACSGDAHGPLALRKRSISCSVLLRICGKKKLTQ